MSPDGEIRRALPVNLRARWLLGLGVGDDVGGLLWVGGWAGVVWLVAGGQVGRLGDERV